MQSTIKIEDSVKKQLRYLKSDDSDTFNDVIERLLEMTKDKAVYQYTSTLPPIIDVNSYPFD